MTIFPPRPPSFTCAICGEFRDWSQGHFFNFRAYAAEYDIPPICRPCEKTWGKGIGGWGDLNRDRRIARQISALAAVLEVEAHRKAHGKAPLYAPA